MSTVLDHTGFQPSTSPTIIPRTKVIACIDLTSSDCFFPSWALSSVHTYRPNTGMLG